MPVILRNAYLVTIKNAFTMIQIDDWMLIAGLLAVFLVFIIYFVYVRITRKLFPETLEYQKEIKPNEAVTISTIEGSGIIKKIEIKTTENEKSWIDITVDQTSFITFGLGKKPGSQSGGLDVSEESLSFEINLYKKFERNFTLFFHNNSDKLAHLNGNVDYEIKKPLKITLITLLSELFH
jgi:preprotein translocase subunit YajC